MKKHPWIFVTTALIFLVVHFFLFSFRYGWYVTPDEADFLIMGYAIGVSAILLLWAFFPSRLAAALVAAGLFLFPPMLRPQDFPGLNTGFTLCATVVVLLAIVATHFRPKSVQAA